MTLSDKKKRLFVTGSTGFVGQWLKKQVQTPPYDDQIEWLGTDARYDIRDQIALTTLLTDLAPDWVIHLAAQSAVPYSFANPKETFDINCLGTISLLQALKTSGFSGRFLYVSSADAYGAVSLDELPIRETRPLAPRNPYAVSKAAAEMVCKQWGLTEGIDVVIARPFNHIGPGQSTQFAVGSFVAQLVPIARGLAPPNIEVGDIETTRDFSDVRDVATAYIALLEHGMSGEIYNVCSGTETRIGDMFDFLVQLAKVKVSLEVSSEKQRRAEQRRMCGNNQKCISETGWKPRYTIPDTLRDIFNSAMEGNQF
jgi:GDP-4-dehydro-6-deoxy-D-mannose reductase